MIVRVWQSVYAAKHFLSVSKYITGKNKLVIRKSGNSNNFLQSKFLLYILQLFVLLHWNSDQVFTNHYSCSLSNFQVIIPKKHSLKYLKSVSKFSKTSDKSLF
jgi:hypothetical protein